MLSHDRINDCKYMDWIYSHSVLSPSNIVLRRVQKVLFLKGHPKMVDNLHRIIPPGQDYVNVPREIDEPTNWDTRGSPRVQPCPQSSSYSSLAHSYQPRVSTFRACSAATPRRRSASWREASSSPPRGAAIPR